MHRQERMKLAKENRKEIEYKLNLPKGLNKCCDLAFVGDYCPKCSKGVQK